jgi:hypothetical protein
VVPTGEATPDGIPKGLSVAVSVGIAVAVVAVVSVVLVAVYWVRFRKNRGYQESDRLITDAPLGIGEYEDM